MLKIPSVSRKKIEISNKKIPITELFFFSVQVYILSNVVIYSTIRIKSNKDNFHNLLNKVLL